MIVMRSIPIEIPSTQHLGLPDMVDKIAIHERGLILVTGVTGSGKGSTMAAMINWINQNKQVHIVTLENPIEFLHRDNKSSITQRDIGTDTESFVSGLRAVLRQDPDVILIGEMRDKTTIETALHTKNAVQTISRIISVFTAEEQEMIRIRLAESLQAVISQRLVRKKTGGRVAAMEIMPVTGTMRDCIRDPARLDEIFDLIAEGKDHYGSQTFDQHLMELVRDDIVTFELAKLAANNQADFDLKMNMFTDPAGSGGQTSTQDDMTQMFGG